MTDEIRKKLDSLAYRLCPECDFDEAMESVNDAYELGEKAGRDAQREEMSQHISAVSLKIVQGAYALHGHPIIGDADKVEAENLCAMIMREVGLL